MKLTHYIPPEIVDMIADYHDYDKYCKPKHQEKFKEVINVIGNRIKTYDIFQELMIKKVQALYHIDRESDTDIAIALEKEICRHCKMCSYIKKITVLEY